MKCTTLLINVIVSKYQLDMNLEYAVKLLTFVNGKILNEMVTTRSLVRIDVVNQKMINYEL